MDKTFNTLAEAVAEITKIRADVRGGKTTNLPVDGTNYLVAIDAPDGKFKIVVSY